MDASKSPKIIKALEKVILNGSSVRASKILLVAVESAPYARVGGVASVVRSLATSLNNLGHDARILIPKFGFIDENLYETRLVLEGLQVPTDDPDNPHLICNVKEHEMDGVITYFLENMEYYELRANVYGYTDDPIRWALLNRGALEFILNGDFLPDVVHCNDWQGGLLPNYLRTVYKNNPRFSKTATVFTIHNLKFQGMFDHKNVSEMDFDDGWSPVAPFFDQRLLKQNFMRRGIIHADIVSTVSRSYAKEITTPEYGEGLDKLITELREKVFGVVNGIDYQEMDPLKDTLLEKNYDINSIHLRAFNKESLQKEFDLEVNKDIPVFGFVGRLDPQKGVDLLVSVLEKVLRRYNLQFVQVGGGDGWLVELLQNLKRSFPDKVGVYPYPNFTLPRLIFGGSDVILYPSRFEPCGVVQLEAMRYGSIPLVRNVGGLKDTVVQFDTGTQKGTGFVFDDFDEFALYGEIIRALEVYKNKQLWKKLQLNAMRADFSWGYSAKEYEKLYLRALEIKSKL
ncbi:MAG: glycogen/starch synthase [Patescibacteria group bacterium]